MALTIESIAVGDELRSRQYTATEVSLFMYNAAVWNPHRIHYDATYTRHVEHHPGVVIDGPLQGDWLSQVALNWIGDSGRMTSFGYSNRLAAYLGETLTAGGRVKAVDPGTRTVTLTLEVTNSRGEITSPGEATVVLDG